MGFTNSKCPGCKLEKCINCKLYREAADKISELAKYYESNGFIELADELKQICIQIHDMARNKQNEK
jgi:hypothetical protein